MIKLITDSGHGQNQNPYQIGQRGRQNLQGKCRLRGKGIKLRFDIDYSVRLINIDEYLVNNARHGTGLWAGLIASNHDITDIFIDSALKICGNNMKGFEATVLELEALSRKPAST